MGNPQNRREAILAEHHDLDAKIQALTGNPGSNDLELQALKKRKLKLKDELALLEREA